MTVCRRVEDASSATAYYLTAAFRKEGQEEVLDLSLTDLQNAWVVTGQHRPSEGLTREHWMTFAKEALLGKKVPGAPPGERQLQWRITPGQPDPDTLSVMWVFMADLGGGERRWKAEVSAHRADDPRPIAEPMVNCLLTELHKAQDTCSQLAASSRGLAAELDEAQTTLERRLSAREAAEEQLYVKFAARLTEGNALAAQYRDRALAAEARLDSPPTQGESAAAQEKLSDKMSDSETPTARTKSNSSDDATAEMATNSSGGASPGVDPKDTQDTAKTSPVSHGRPSGTNDKQDSVQAVPGETEQLESPKRRVVARRRKRPPAGTGCMADVGDFSQL